jgi:hypothetical protein
VDDTEEAGAEEVETGAEVGNSCQVFSEVEYAQQRSVLTPAGAAVSRRSASALSVSSPLDVEEEEEEGVVVVWFWFLLWTEEADAEEEFEVGGC